MLHKEGTENFNVVGKNAYWANAADVENLDKAEGSVMADPQFADPNHFDFMARGLIAEQGYGLTNSSLVREVYETYRQMQRIRQIEATTGKKVSTGSDVPPAQWRQTLLTGDSKARREVLRAILMSDRATVPDASLLPAMRVAATDGDIQTRAEVASTVGTRWVWDAKDQDANAIEPMLKLSSDSERQVRYNAVYYGLSNVRNAGEPVVRRLIEMTMTDHERDFYGRVVWGLKGPLQASPDLVTRILAEGLGRVKSDLRHAASIYSLYRDVLEKEPPVEWGLAKVKERYPDDAFALFISAQESFKPQDEDALWNEFTKSLPQGITTERLPSWFRRRGEVVCAAKLRGKEQVDAVKGVIENSPRLQWRDAMPLTVADQLFFEEAPALMRR